MFIKFEDLFIGIINNIFVKCIGIYRQMSVYSGKIFYKLLFTYKSEVRSMSLSGKNILMIIASNNFRDEEYKYPREVFESEGAKITVASSTKREVTGMLGMKVNPDILLNEVVIDNYDAVVFVGGTGSIEYWDNNWAHRIAKEAYEKCKIIGAICIAPVTLARAGLLRGKKATVYSSEIDNIKKEGAIYTGKPVEVDGTIVTGNGPSAAKEFSEKIVDLLKQKS